MSKTKEEILKELAHKAWSFARNAHRLYPDNKHTFSDYSATLLNEDIQCAEREIFMYAKEKSIAFSKWKDKLTPVQRCTVWPPVGSGSGTGLYLKSDDDLWNEFLIQSI